MSKSGMLTTFNHFGVGALCLFPPVSPGAINIEVLRTSLDLDTSVMGDTTYQLINLSTTY